MVKFEQILNKDESISLVGLGYVGMPIAVAFAKKVKVIGFDINENKVIQYKSGIDLTHEIVKWCVETGIKKFVLGGGHAKNDGIYNYKKAFSNAASVPFYVGKVIHDEELYNRLSSSINPSEDNINYFPLYRLQNNF